VASTVPLVCAPLDGGSMADAGFDGGVDAAMEAAVDVPVDVPPQDTCLGDEADLPGDHLDQNCDGVDGVLGRQIYVSTTGADTNDGLTPTRPFLSLDRALGAVGLVASGMRRVILLTAGEYAAPLDMSNNTAFFDVRQGVSIHGGYTSGFVTARTDAATVLRGLGAGLVVRNTTDDVTLTGLTLRGTWPSTMPLAGQTGYGLLLVNTGVVRLSRSRIEAPSGGPGADGRPPSNTSPGSAGNAANGTSLGTGGQGCTSDSNGGDGGEGGGPLSGVAPGMAGRTPMGLPVGLPGQPGVRGTSGGPGVAGRPGHFSANGYVPQDATRGEPGSAGGGGSGGNSGNRSTQGGGGGGGGGGGCGGDGGGGGRGGGGSIGIYAFGCGVRLELREVAITRGDGGRGGSGVAGQMGRRGGMGGMGGIIAAGTTGESGLEGGEGGNGGPGGRGAGGPSLGLALVAGAELVQNMGVTFGPGQAGASGEMGEGVPELAVSNEQYRPPVAYDATGQPLPMCGAAGADAGVPQDAGDGGSR